MTTTSQFDTLVLCVFGGSMELKWTQKYSVNNEIIDIQHKKLFSIVNRLSRAISEGDGLLIIESVLEEMSQYAWMHFRTEEDLLSKLDYDALQEHKALHDCFKKEILHVSEELLHHKSMEQVVEIHKFLQKWLNDHILEEDVKYCDYL